MENAHRKTCRQQITRLINAVNELLTKNDEEVDVEDLSVMITRLKTSNELLQRANEAVLAKITDEKVYETDYEKILDYEDKVTTAVARLGERRKRIERATAKVSEEPQNLNRDEPVITGDADGASIYSNNSGRSETRSVNERLPQRNAIKLPRLELKKFNGELVNWTPFWEQFKATVHDNETLDNVTKFNYLQSVLTGKAAATIKGLTASEACYDDAIDMLKNEYGNTQKLIDNYVQQLLSINSVKNVTDIHGLRSLYNTVSSLTRSLQALGVNANNYGMMAKSVLIKALPYKMRINYFKQGNEKQENEPEYTYEEEIDRLLNFIKIELESMELANTTPTPPSKVENKEPRKFNNLKFKEFTAAGLLTKIEECLFCKSQSHVTSQCNIKTLEQRKEILKKNNRCFRCTGTNHNSKNCRTKNISCKKCSGRHVTSMCDPNFKRQRDDKATERETVNVATTSVSQLFASNRVSNLFLKTACAYILNKDEQNAFVRMVIDGGSHLTFIKESVSRQLNLPVIGTKKLSVTAFGTKNQATPKLYNRVVLRLQGQYSDEIIELTAIEVPEICFDSLTVPTTSDTRIKGLFLADARISGLEPIPGISILIGSDYYWKVITGEYYRITENLVAVNSKFGWTIHGRDENFAYEFNANLTTALQLQVVETEDTNVDLQSFWKLETIGISASQNNKPVCVNFTDTFIEQKIKYDADSQRYEVALPWKGDPTCLDSNYINAHRRVKHLTRKLLNDYEKFQEYDNAIRNYVNNDCAELISTEENEKINNIYYMPHRAIYREDKTTPIRIVFDASSHSPNTPSLNELLCTGENLVPEVLKIFLNFRIGKIGVVADIEKAFLQILLSKEERDFHSFLWYNEPFDVVKPLPELVRFRMKRVTFGVTCSPFLLSATLKKHFKSVCNEYPNTSALLSKSFYVDDLVIAFDSEESAKTLFIEAQEILRRANMNLRKWQSNDEELREFFGAENGVNSDNLKVLGVDWCLKTDNLSVTLTHISVTGVQIITKRFMLQTIAKIYDPLGVIVPCVVKAKLLMQSVWKIKIDWDNIVPKDIANEWLQWVRDVVKLQDFAIPRACVVSTNLKVQLHVFADASMQAFGAVAYLRSVDETGKVACNFLIAKNRIAPINTTGTPELTLPKLELTAAVCAVRLQVYILDTLQLDFENVYLWSDSKITLSWIRGNTFKQKPYVSNRVNEIKDFTRGEWRFCPGNLNPADLLTRPTKSTALIESSLWLHGPEFLKEDIGYWPEETNHNVQEVLVTEIVVSDKNFSPADPIFDFNKFSSLEKTLRVTAYVLRFIYNARKCLGQRIFGQLNVEEINDAETYWIKIFQFESYRDEIQNLRNDKPVNSSSKIFQLNPFLDDNGILRLGGRLQESTLSYETKHPTILSKRCSLVTKLIWHEHNAVMHRGVSMTLAAIRKKFWIVQGRQVVKSVLSKCIVCKKLKVKSGDEPFAPLPRERILENVRPFFVTGTDFFGPLYVTDATGKRDKVYGLIVTCAVVRAVHLELVKDLTTESCVQALRRFFARRGVPNVIYSDNAKTFKRTSVELCTLSELLKSEEVQNLGLKHRIKWRFIVERASWWGGWWERLIKIVKDCLKASLGRATLNFEELRTILVEIESVINSRPLTYLGADPDDLSYLSPNQFLIGSNSTFLPNDFSGKIIGRNEILLQWKARTHLVAKFWKKWVNEYLLSLSSAHKIRQGRRSCFREGDIVLLHDENNPRLIWKLARVTKTFPGRDGRIRSCEIQLSNRSITRRPIQLLHPLELRAPEDVEDSNRVGEHREESAALAQ